jgi:hypothetical protein
MHDIIKKKELCYNKCYDKISVGTFPKFEDVTCCDNECITDCYISDCNEEKSECLSVTLGGSTYTQKTLNDKSTMSVCDNITNKKSCCESYKKKHQYDTVCKKSCNTDICDECEPICEATCNKLVKRYNCSKQELLAYSDIITMLNFLKSKLEQVQPNIDNRDISSYSEIENINWLECFIDTLFCVLKKNDAYKVINVSECKIKNSITNINRTYLIKVKYTTSTNRICITIPLYFRWTQLTNNESKSYKGVLNYVVKQLSEEIHKFQAASTVPFLCC